MWEIARVINHSRIFEILLWKTSEYSVMSKKRFVLFFFPFSFFDHIVRSCCLSWLHRHTHRSSNLQWHLLFCLSVSCFVIIRKKMNSRIPSHWFYVWLIGSSHFLGLISRYYHMIYVMIYFFFYSNQTSHHGKIERQQTKSIITLKEYHINSFDRVTFFL